MPSIAQAREALALFEADGDIENAALVREAIRKATASFTPTAEDIEREMQLSRRRATLVERPPKDPGFFENVTSGFGAGAVGFGEMAGLGAVALLDEEAELAARDKIKAAADYLRPEGGDTDSITYNISSGLGSIAGALGVTGAAALGAVPLGGSAAIAGTGAGILSGIAASAGEASERAREFGTTEDERNLAILKAAPLGALQAIPGARLLPAAAVQPLKNLSNKLGPDVVESILSKAAAKRIAGTGAIEAGEEAIQEMGQNLAAQGYDPEAELIEGTGTAFGYGGAAGAIMQAVMILMPGGRRRASPTEETTEETTTQAPLLDDSTEGESELITDETAVDPEVIAAAEETAVDPEVIAAAEAVSAPVDVEAVRAKLFEGLVFDDDGNLDGTVEGNVAEFLDRRAALSREEQRALKQVDKKADTAAPAVVEELTDAQVDAKLQEAGAAEATLDTDAELEEGEVIDEQSDTATAAKEKLDAAGGGTGDADNIRSVGDGAVRENTVETDTSVTDPVDESGSGVGGTTTRTGKQLDPLAVKNLVAKSEELKAKEPFVITDGKVSKQERVRVEPKPKDPADDDTIALITDADRLANSKLMAASQALIAVQNKPEPTQNEFFTAAKLAEPDRDYREIKAEADRNYKEAKAEYDTELANAQEAQAKAIEEFQAEKLDSTPIKEAEDALVTSRKATVAGEDIVDLEVDQEFRTSDKPRTGKAPRVSASEQDAINTFNKVYGEEFTDSPVGKDFLEFTKETPKLNLPQEDLVTVANYLNTVGKLPKNKPKKVSPELWQEQQALAKYFDAGDILDGDATSGLTLAAYDSAIQAAEMKTPTAEVAQQPDREAAIFAGMGKVRGDKVLAWAKKNLSTAGYARVQDVIDGIKEKDFEAGKASRLNEKMKTSAALFSGRAKLANNKKRVRQGVPEEALTDAEKEAIANFKPASKSTTRPEPMVNRTKLDEKAAEEGARTETDARMLRKLRDQGVELTKEQTDIITAADARIAYEKDYKEKLAQAEKESLALPKNAIESLEVTPQQVIDAVLQVPSETVISLPYALEAIVRHHPNSVVKQFAKKLLANVGTTKLKVVENLINDDGTLAAGIFDPKTNTVTLDKDYGVNTHTILHEMGHAGLSASLANPKAGSTKRLQKIYDESKDQLSSYYGSQSLDEFLSEYMANSKFRNELAGMSTTTSASALQDVQDWVRNMFRRLIGKPVKKRDTNTVLDELIDAVLAPAPEQRDAGKLLMSIKEGKIPKAITKATGNDAVRELRKNRTEALSNGFQTFFGNSTSTAADKGLRAVKGVAAGLLNMQALADQASIRLGIDSVADLDVAFQEQNGRVARINSRLTATATDITNKLKRAEAANKNVDVIRTFDELTTDSTMDRVDPSKDSDYYKKNKKKQAIWEAQRPAWENLGPDGRAAYVQLRTAYAEIMDDMQKALSKRIKDASGEGASTEKVNTLLKTIFDRSKIEPYFPLLREGDYWLRYYVKPTDGPPEVVVESFESPAARTRAQVSLKEDSIEGFTVTGIEPFESIQDMGLSSSNIPPTSFVAEIIKTLNESIPEATAADRAKKQETIDGIVNDFIQSVPESSFLKAFRKRENKLGAADSAMRAFNVKGYGMARRAEAIKGAENIRKIAREVDEEITGAVENGRIEDISEANILKEEIRKRVELTVSPSDSWLDNLAIGGNKLAFVGTLGFNAAGALNNAASIPMVILPFLAGRTNMQTATAAMAAATKFFTGSGLSHKVTPFGNTAIVEGSKDVLNSYMPSIDNYYAADAKGQLQIRDDVVDEPNYYQMPIAGGKTKSMSKKEFLGMVRDVVQTSADRSLLNRSLLADQLGLELAADPKAGTLGNAWDKFNKWAALPFHTVERFNRQATVIGAFLNEMARLNATPNKAKNEDKLTDAEKQRKAMATALHDTAQLNGGAGLNSAPRYAQKQIGRVAMMFKTYGFTMYYNQLMMARAALKQAKENGLDDESIRIARKQFIASQGAALAMSGVQGLTIVGIAQGLADLFLDDEEEDADALTRQYLNDFLYKGGVQYLTAFAGAEIDIATRIGLSNLILGNNKYDFNKSNKEEFVDLIGGPALGYLSSIGRGLNDIYEGETRRGIEAMSPAFARNMQQAVRFGQEGALTRRGDPITDDMNAGELTAKFFGYAPAKYSNAQERNQDLKKIDTTVSKNKSRLLKQLYTTIRMGEDPSDVMEEIMTHNRRHSGKGKEAVITPDSINRSMKMHAKTSVTMYNGVTLSPAMRAYARETERRLEEEPWFMND